MGISSSEAKMNFRLIQAQAPPVYPEDAININIINFVNWNQLDSGVERGINTFIGLDMGKGLFQDFSIRWGEPESLLQLFRKAFYDYLSVRGDPLDLGVTKDNDPEFAWVAVEEGAIMNDDLMINRTWWDWSDEEHEVELFAALYLQSAVDYENASIVMEKDGVRRPDVIEPDMPDPDDFPPLAGA